MRSFIKKSVVALLGLFAVGAAMAAPPDYSSLTGAIDFSTTITAVLAASAALMAVYIVWKGASLIIRAVKGL